jgi:N-acetylglucosaminyldiphosphoundecaprenol N-acetyl-beta-D-mannosaminyltransferase
MDIDETRRSILNGSQRLGTAQVAELPTESLSGVDFAAVTEGRLIDWTLDRLREGIGTWVCPVNLDVLRQVVESAEIRSLVGSADAVVADGMPLVWASHLQGTPLPERVAGSSLLETLSAEAAIAGRSVFLLGGSRGAAAAAGVRLRERSPGLRIAGWHFPPLGFERSPRGPGAIVEQLQRTRPDIVFVGLGFPKQDLLIAELRPVLPWACFVSCGASFSMVSGELPRAPRPLQRTGLEWAYRMRQEPRRLAKRYLVQGLPFAARLGAHSLRGRLGSDVLRSTTVRT